MIEAWVSGRRRRWRTRRVALFRREMALGRAATVLDVGGRPDIWALADDPPRVTLLNLAGEVEAMPAEVRQHFAVVAGDACRLPDIAAGFDAVFSNSVLEHVGSRRRQEQFASVVRRGRAYWVQVPAPSFPLEPHCRVPFWWLLPRRLRARTIRRWYRGEWRFEGRQMAGTRPISRRLLRELFPDGRILVERWFGLPKSYYVYRP